MLIYFVMLALGLFFIYSLRDALLILQNRRDEKEKRIYMSIIQQNSAQCKRFENAS